MQVSLTLLLRLLHNTWGMQKANKVNHLLKTQQSTLNVSYRYRRL